MKVAKTVSAPRRSDQKHDGHCKIHALGLHNQTSNFAAKGRLTYMRRKGTQAHVHRFMAMRVREEEEASENGRDPENVVILLEVYISVHETLRRFRATLVGQAQETSKRLIMRSNFSC